MMHRLSSSTAQAGRLGLSLTLVFLVGGCTKARTSPEPVRSAAVTYAITPLPEHLAARAGELRLDTKTRILVSDTASSALRSLADLLAVPLRTASGLPLTIGPA